MKMKLAVFVFVVLLLGLGAAVLAFEHSPVNTQTSYSAEIGCDTCEGEPLQRQIRACEEREFLKGTNGEQRRQKNQRFGN